MWRIGVMLCKKKKINEISGPVKKGISLPLIVSQLLHMKSAVLSGKIRMRFLCANRPSTGGMSLSPKRHTSQAFDAGQSQLLIESYIQLRFIELSRVENLFWGFSPRRYGLFRASGILRGHSSTFRRNLSLKLRGQAVCSLWIAYICSWWRYILSKSPVL